MNSIQWPSPNRYSYEYTRGLLYNISFTIVKNPADVYYSGIRLIELEQSFISTRKLIYQISIRPNSSNDYGANKEKYRMTIKVRVFYSINPNNLYVIG